MRCLLFDGDPNARNHLRTLLTEHFPPIQIVAETTDLENARNALEESQPDLALLNIDSEGPNSLDLLREFKKEGKLHFDIVFLCEQPHFDLAVQALEFAALDFVVKPVHPDALGKAIQTALHSYKNRTLVRNKLEDLFQLNPKINGSETLCIPLLKGELAFVSFHEIAYLESQTEVTRIQLQSGDNILAMRNIGYFEKILIPEQPFFRISQKIIVYIPYVRRYNHQDLKVTLKNGQSLDASRQGGRDFRRHFLDQESRNINRDLLAFIYRWLKTKEPER
jgi:two-component system LytT family response regulator